MGKGQGKGRGDLDMPIKAVIGVIIAIVIIFLIAIICPWNAWNTDDGAIVNTDVGIWEITSKQGGHTTTYKYDDHSSLSKYKDAGDAAFGLIFVAIILLVAVLVIVFFLLSPVMLLVACVLAFVAFIFEMSAWANWADSIGDGDFDYGGAFIVAMYPHTLLASA